MLDEEKVYKESESFQNKIEGIFKKHGLEINVLDKDKSSRRPDFFVQFKNNPYKGFVCECKYIASAGVIDNGKYHLSTHDLHLATRNKGAFQFDSSDKLESVIRNALSQYESLIKDKPQYEKFPFIIAVGLDFFADDFYLIPKGIYGLREISAVMKIERNFEQKEELGKWSLGELEQAVKGKSRKKIPPESVRFKILLNPLAKRRFKAIEFFRNPIIV